MKNNVAGRIYKILSLWTGYQDADPAFKGWLRALNVKENGNVRGYFAIYHKLSLLICDLDHLRAQLKASNFTPAVYGPPLDKVEQALSPALISHQCVHVKQHLTPDVYTALTFCSDMLPSEEFEISEEDFKAIVGLISDLELTLGESSLPSSLVSLIRRHIELAEVALADYPLRGASALKDAVKFAIGDLATELELTKDLTIQAATSLGNPPTH